MLALSSPVHYAWSFARLHLWDGLLHHVNSDWDRWAFLRWFIGQVIRIPVKFNIEKPFIMFSHHFLVCLLSHWHFLGIILHWLVTYSIDILFPNLVWEAEDIRRLVVIDHLVCFVVCMVHHTSGDWLDNVIWCSCAFTSLPCFKVLCLAVMASSTSLFHHQVSRRHQWGFVVPHTSSVVFSKSVLSFTQISSVVVAASVSTAGTCALKTFWNWLHVWWSLSFHTFGCGVNLRQHVNHHWAAYQSTCQTQGADAAEQPLLQESPSHPWQVCAGSFEITWSLSGLLYYWTCMWWGDCNISWNMCYRGTGHMLVHIPGSSHPYYLGLACHTHSFMNFVVTWACTAYLAIPITAWDKEFLCWDHFSHGPK